MMETSSENASVPESESPGEPESSIFIAPLNSTTPLVQSCLRCKGSAKTGKARYMKRTCLENAISAQVHDTTSTQSSVQIGCDVCHKSTDKDTPIATTAISCAFAFKDYWGILLTLASGLASTFGGIIVKILKDFHPFSLATYRFQGIVFPTLCIVLYYRFVRKENVFESVWPVSSRDSMMKLGFTVIRALVGCLGLYLWFYAIQLMPLADAKIIGSCRPVFVTLIAHLFLGEKCGIFPVLSSLICIAGVAIISRPPIFTGESEFDSDILMGTVFATLSMLSATLTMVVLRYLRTVHVAVVTLAFGFWGTIISMACSATIERFDVPQTLVQWVLVVSLATAAFFSQTALTLAMKYDTASTVVIVLTCDTIMSYVLQYIFLGHSPDAFSIVGAVLIIMCVSLITFRKWVNSLPLKHYARKRFWFVLK